MSLLSIGKCPARTDPNSSARFARRRLSRSPTAGHGERSRVIEAVNVGVNEFLLKPVSTNALLGRFVSIIAKPRRMVRKGDYYGPEPRPLSRYKPEEATWS